MISRLNNLDFLRAHIVVSKDTVNLFVMDFKFDFIKEDKPISLIEMNESEIIDNPFESLGAAILALLEEMKLIKKPC